MVPGRCGLFPAIEVAHPIAPARRRGADTILIDAVCRCAYVIPPVDHWRKDDDLKGVAGPDLTLCPRLLCGGGSFPISQGVNS
jgi:hypothetical protein